MTGVVAAFWVGVLLVAVAPTRAEIESWRNRRK